MKRRPELTVLFAGSQRVLRVDLSADARTPPAECFEAGAPSGARLAEVLLPALQGRPHPAARTLIVTERVWTQTIELPPAAIRGLSGPELARAVAFELEPFCGISAQDSTLGVLPLSAAAPDAASTRLWAVTLQTRELAAVETLLAEHGSALVALLHPAGLGAEADTARVEVWEQATACSLASAAGEDTLVLGSSAGQRSWESGIAAWIARHPGVRLVWSGAAVPSALAGAAAIEERPRALDEDPARWLGELGRRFLNGELRAPSVRGRPRARIRPGPRFFGTLATVAALALVFQLGRVGDRTAHDLELRADNFETDLAASRQKRLRRAELEKSLGEVRGLVRGREGTLAGLESEFNAQRSRHAALLAALASERPEGLVVLGIRDTAEGGLRIEGAGLDPEAVHRYAARLEPKLAAAHWAIAPLQTSERGSDIRRKHLAFALEVVPQLQDGLSHGAAATPAGAPRTGRSRARRDS